MNMKKRSGMMEMPKKVLLVGSLAIAAIMASGCWNPFSPDTQGPSESLDYYYPVDSAWKAVKNLEYAYVARSIDHYMDCFRDDFEFHLLEVDWDDYNGDGIIDEYWGIDLEEAFTETMFDRVNSIELSLSGDSQQPWSGDSTGQSLMLTRTFDLKVYADPQGYRASGTALFICRQDTTTGDWYIWQWWDQSEI